MAEKLGFEGKLYRNAGTYAVPVWTEMDIVRDLTVNLEAGKADASSRGSRWKLYLAAMIDAGVEADLIYSSTDASYLVMRAAAIANPPTVLDFAIADGPIATIGTNYLRIHSCVFNLGHAQPLEDAMTNTFMLAPSPNVNADPTYTVIT